MNALDRIQQLINERGWTLYRLSKECGLSDCTLINSYRRHNQPSLGTLEAICNGLGITLSQFFAEDEMMEVTPKQKELLSLWTAMTAEQQNAVLAMMHAFSRNG